jgi:Secretion system C-terminal sorting domain
MRKNLRRSFVLLGVGLFITSSVLSQSDGFAFAITDLGKDGSGWNALRKINTQTGEYSDVLLNGSDVNQVAYDATTKRTYLAGADTRFGNYLQPAFSTGVAALAYDKRNNRLYFTPMYIDQLRYIDLKTMKLYYVSDQVFTSFGNMNKEEGKIVTRMVITPDGNGYAITNDGNTFIRFGTGKKIKPVILGSLVDDPGNNNMSIHTSCTSFGGDMVADDNGNLFIITARNLVFKVNIETRSAKYLATIQGLPANFTTNGVVVDQNGALLAASAVYARSYYTINPKTWTATEFKSESVVYRSSDLANSNILITKKTAKELAIIPISDFPLSKNIQLYPNPVTNHMFTIQFSKLDAGDYVVELVDVTGRSVMQRRVSVISEIQTENVVFNRFVAQGVYMVKVIDRNKKSLFTQKLVVQ